MTAFLFNIVLALIWTALTGRLDLFNFGLGLVLGGGAIWLSRFIWGAEYFRRIGRGLVLFGWCLAELATSALVMILDSIVPRRGEPPIVFGLPLTVDREGEIALLSCLVSLSPRVLVVGVSPDRSRLYVRAPKADRQRVEARAKRVLERLILETLR